jgi:GrpB protein
MLQTSWSLDYVYAPTAPTSRTGSASRTPDAAEYADLKRALAAKYPENREAHTDAKADFIGRVLSR